MIREFAKNSFVYSVGTVLTRGLGLILMPVYTRYLNPGEYGVIDLFMIIASIVNIVITLEISQAVARFYHDAENENEKIGYISSAFLFTFTVYCLFLGVAFFFSEDLSVFLLNEPDHIKIVNLAAGSIATGGMFIFSQNILKWHIKPGKFVMAGLVNALFTSFVAIYLLVIEDMKIEAILIGQIIGNVAGLLVSINYVKQSYRVLFILEKFKEMICFSFPIVFSSIAVFIALFIDRIAIKDLIGIEALGIYGVAYRFAAVASLIMVSFQSSLTPLVYKHYKEEGTPKKISDIFKFFLVFSIFVAAGAVVFSDEVVILMSTKEYYSSSVLVAPLVLAVFFSSMYIFAPGLGLAKKTKTMALISIVVATLNVILNYTMIPLMGIMGAALSTLFSAAFAFGLYVVLGNRHYPIQHPWSRVLMAFVFVIASGYMIDMVFNEVSFVNVVIKVLYLLLVFVFLIFTLIAGEYRNKILKRIMVLKA